MKKKLSLLVGVVVLVVLVFVVVGLILEIDKKIF
jgi:hypothetical protein